MRDESADAFFSFQPWWSHHENRSVYFLAVPKRGQVYFYSSFDEYPQHYEAPWVDQNGMIAIRHTDASYAIPDGPFGTYYIRVRPEYVFADAFTDGDHYECDFYAIS